MKACDVCNYKPIGNPEATLNERITVARATVTSGCLHQAADLIVQLLHAADERGAESNEPTIASICLTTLFDPKSDGVYEAAFMLADNTLENPLIIRRGSSADNPAQAAFNLLVEMQDEMLFAESKKETKH